MIREDRELLAELARLNSDMASLALRVMEGCASAGEQRNYAQRLIDVGARLRRRADQFDVVDGEVLVEKSLGLPERPAKHDRQP